MRGVSTLIQEVAFSTHGNHGSMVSKKSASIREKISRITETAPSLLKAPMKSIWNRELKEGIEMGEPLREGIVCPQPVGVV